MHIGAKALELLLVLDPEMLLFINDNKAKALEPDLITEHRMGADDDLEGAVLQPCPRLGGVPGRHHPRQVAHLDRPAGEPLAEGLEMLPRQQGRRADDGHLLPAHGHDKGGPQRDLGLAEADVAADQSIHRRALAEVLQHIADGVQLVVRLLIGEAGAELVEQPLRRHNGGRGPQRPLGRKRDQPLGHVAQTGLGLGLARLPARAAQPVQLRPVGLRAVAGQEVDVLDRQIQFAVAGVEQFQTVVRGLLDLQRLQPLIASDAMIQVDHQIAGRQGRGLGQEVGRPPLLLRPGQPVAQHVGLGDDGDSIRLEPVLDRQDAAQIEILRCRLDIGPVAHCHHRLQPVVRQHGRQSLGRAFGPGGEQNPLARRLQRLGMARHGLEQIDAVLRALGGEVPSQPATGILAGPVEGRQPPHPAAGQGVVPVAFTQIQPLRRQGPIRCPALAHGRVAPGLICVPGEVPALGPRRLHLIVEEQPRIVRQIVEQGLQPVVEQRQPVFHALPPRALADRGVERIVARRPEQAQIAGAETRDAVGVQQGLGHRCQMHLAALTGRTLGGRVEGSDRLQLGAEHVQPHRLLKAGGIDVDDPAAHGELALLRHGRGPHIAVGCEIPLQCRRIEIKSDRGLETGPVGDLAWRCPLHGRADGGYDQHRLAVARRALRQSRQGRHPLRRNRRGRAQPVIGQAVPGRELDHLDALGEEAEGLNKLAHPGIVPRHEKPDAAPGLQPFGHDKGIEPLGGTAQFLFAAWRTRTVHQPAPSATAEATWSRMKSRTFAITGVSCTSGVGSVPMIQA